MSNLIPQHSVSRQRLKCDGTRAETRFRLSAKRTSPFKQAGASVQSTTGSRGARISGSNAGYTMFRGSVKSTGYLLHSVDSLHFPSRASPCAITFQLHSSCDFILANKKKYQVFKSVEQGQLETAAMFQWLHTVAVSKLYSLPCFGCEFPPQYWVLSHDLPPEDIVKPRGWQAG